MLTDALFFKMERSCLKRARVGRRRKKQFSHNLIYIAEQYDIPVTFDLKCIILLYSGHIRCGCNSLQYTIYF